MQYVSFKILQDCDSEKISKLLLTSDKIYTKYFHPFGFQGSIIQEILLKLHKDKFFGIELKHDESSNNEAELVGFYMLRGLDEGYNDPMFGVFLSEQYSGKGIGRISIAHAETFCKFCGYEQLLLKVHTENIRAKKLYESLGFLYLREEVSTKNLVLYKNIHTS